MRTFVAVELPPELCRELCESAQIMRDLVGQPFRVTPAQNLHATLRFFGELPEERLPELSEALRQELTGSAAFRVDVGGYGVFPGPDRARVLWAGIDDADRRLQDLAARADRAAVAVGYEPERRPYRPHITIGRCRRPTELPMQRFFERVDSAARRELLVDRVTVFKSDTRPEGSVYTVMESIPLVAA